MSLNRVPRIFSTHPMDADRIQKTEKEIQRILPDKPEYVVNTSEYTSIRERLIRQDSKRKVVSTTPGEKPEEDRPTIKRRDLIE